MEDEQVQRRAGFAVPDFHREPEACRHSVANGSYRFSSAKSRRSPIGPKRVIIPDDFTAKITKVVEGPPEWLRQDLMSKDPVL